MLSIRKYEEKDYEGVCYACLNSDEDDDMSDELCEFVLHTFCEYYIEKEPENCFVLDDDGKAVGYIICAENFDKFKEVFYAEYYPRSLHLGQGRLDWANEAYLLHEKYKADYPAHLHIDILPAYQRGGNGGMDLFMQDPQIFRSGHGNLLSWHRGQNGGNFTEMKSNYITILII